MADEFINNYLGLEEYAIFSSVNYVAKTGQLHAKEFPIIYKK
mgnify:CR=1 FL=1